MHLAGLRGKQGKEKKEVKWMRRDWEGTYRLMCTGYTLAVNVSTVSCHRLRSLVEGCSSRVG